MCMVEGPKKLWQAMLEKNERGDKMKCLQTQENRTAKAGRGKKK